MNKQNFNHFIFKFSLMLLLSVSHLMVFSEESTPQIKVSENFFSTMIFKTHIYESSDKQHWVLPLHFWLYEKETSVFRKGLVETVLSTKYDIEIDESNETIFIEHTAPFFASNVKRKRLPFSINAKPFKINPTEKNGQSLTLITLDKKSVDLSNMTIKLNNHIIQPFIPPKNSGVIVISDIDDTIKITQVTEQKLMIENTFTKPFKAIQGMSDLYQHWDKTQQTTFHYVSSSPWQLYGLLSEFLSHHQFPEAQMHLKKVRFKDKTLFNLFKPGIETKPKQISEIINHYPEHQFILVGDSGENDPEVYSKIAHKYPNKIRAIYIHNMTNETMQNKRMTSSIANLEHIDWALFKHPNELKRIEPNEITD